MTWEARLRLATVVPLAAVAAVLVATAAGAPAGPGAAVVGLLLGVPHGAADVASPVLRPRGSGPGRGLAGLGGYAALAATVLLLEALVPAVALAALLVLSCWHFGEADAELARARGVRAGWLTVVVMGAAPVVLVLGGHPDAVLPPTRTLAGPAAAGLLGVLADLVPAVVAGAGLLAVQRWRHGDRLGATEPALLVVAFQVAPPYAAFGIWFAGWHAVRQTALRPRAPWVPTALASAVAVVSAAGLIALNGTSALPALVAVLLALTVPHTLVGALEVSRRTSGAGAPRASAPTTASRARRARPSRPAPGAGPHARPPRRRPAPASRHRDARP